MYMTTGKSLESRDYLHKLFIAYFGHYEFTMAMLGEWQAVPGTNGFA